jgi:hypothetical protein
MQENILDSLTRLLRYQRSAVTDQFRAWKHNRDILPKLQQQLEAILNAYGKFQPIVYDTQGIRDDGVDIALSYFPEGNSDQKQIIGFQAKSFDDLKPSNYLQSIKAQHDDAFRKVKELRYYFVLLCTDAKMHKDKVRAIEGEYRSDARTEIIEPEFAYTFLHHPKTRIDSLIKRVFESDDIVFREALDSLDQTSPSARALAIFLAVKYTITGETAYPTESLFGEAILRRIYERLRIRQEELLDATRQAAIERDNVRENGEVPEDEDENYDDPPQVAEFTQQVAEDLELLKGDMVDTGSNSSSKVYFRGPQQLPLIAVIADARARYRHSDAELTEYMFSVMGVVE